MTDSNIITYLVYLDLNLLLYDGHTRLIDSSIKSIQRTEFSILSFKILTHLWIGRERKKKGSDTSFIAI